MRLERILDNNDQFQQIVELAGGEEEGEFREAGDFDRAAVTGRLSDLQESWVEGRDVMAEAIVREYGRPVLFIQDGRIEEPKLPDWKARLAAARDRIERVIPSVGRVEILNHPDLPWAGTGWLVAEDVAVTNRHVAREFAESRSNGFVFRRNPFRRTMKAYLDTLEEHDRGEECTYRVREILYVEKDGDDRPDVAFLKVKRASEEEDSPLPDPIPLSSSDPQDGDVIGAIGYAARDGFRNPGEAMKRIFRGIYNVKRLHPGEVMRQVSDQGFFTHDCSTLGGNSGSAIVAFDTGEAVGLHFAGSFLNANYAVNASVVRELLWTELKING
jgi:endonuclease G